MKSFRDYLSEAELTEGNPAVGDIFELEIARDETLIETYIVDVFEDGIVLEADDTVMRILTHAGYLTEDSNMPTARDSISPIHSNANKDQSSDNDLENKYMDKDQGATAPKKPTRNPADTSPLTEPKAKKDPKDYMVHEDEFKWGQDTFTDKYGGVNKYDPKTNSYQSTGPVVPNDNKTSVSAINSQRTKATNSSKGDSTYDQEYSSTSVFRDPKTGAGDYLKTQLKGDDYEQDYQTDVSKPWLDYTLDKARHDADTMMQEPGSYKSVPQAPMSQFRATTNEAKYRGRTVPLGKKMPGDVKKSKVYVRKPNGNIVKVEFGDPNMRIKKSNPKRRKSFRARHNCANPGPRWKARYWSCRSW
jgi:hypothetical protein